MTNPELFKELSKPDDQGYSRWVDVNEFKGKFKSLKLGNGASWPRASSKLSQEFNIITLKKNGDLESTDSSFTEDEKNKLKKEKREELDKLDSKNNSIKWIKMHGKNNSPKKGCNSIDKEIHKQICSKDTECVLCSSKQNIQCDHKNGRKDPQHPSMSHRTQKLEHFQPLCQHCNTIKREKCKKCINTNERPKGRLSKAGKEEYKGTCEGCPWYDIEDYDK